jgi:hypothetical protein
MVKPTVSSVNAVIKKSLQDVCSLNTYLFLGMNTRLGAVM